ncbi:tail fiber assembly protein [Serratia symbiotica]|uniref:tail fiber assembly protein n=1 Tax=Serratia symbiotica TaxID=138074 RepID=UPI0013602B90|nr:tail fiber assembly protein [Serratia symbiotica]MBQ0955689.1 tail fiber assembly protein [Serratia symbiotica]
MAKATLNKHGIATKAGDITVYNYDNDTREYRSVSVEFLAAGVGIPANSCTDAPADEKAGFALCRTGSLDGWEYVSDHRGETVYDKETGQSVEISALGDYPDSVTPLAPLKPYDRWSGSAWVTDEEAQKRGQLLEAEQKKATLLASAKNTITLWQTELQLGIIGDEDRASLITWMKYIQALQDVDTTPGANSKWPKPPEI